MKFGGMFSIFVLALLALGAFSFADLSVSNTTTLPSVVRPGTQGLVSMVVTNSDTTEIKSVNAQASGTGGIVSQSSKFLGDYKPGTSGSVTIPFSVPEEADAGLYTLAVKFSWLNDSGTFFKSVYVPVTVTNPAIFSVQSLNNSILTTGDFQIHIKIENSGGGAKNVRISINSTQFLQTGPNPLIAGDILNGDSIEVVFGVTLAPNVVSGAYLLPLSITYNDESGSELTTEVKPRIEVRKTSANVDISLNEAHHFIPGHEIPIKLRIENNGDQNAYDVKIGIAGSSDLSSLSKVDYDSVLTSLGGTYVTVGTLAAGESKLITLSAGVNDLNSGFYRQYFIIKAKDSNGDSLADELQPIGINVEGLTAVEVFVSSKPAPIVSGAEHTLSVLVSNIGTSPLKALIVKVSGGEFFELMEAQDQQFIGGLIEDDFSTVQYKVRIKNVPAGIYPLNVTTSFKDSYNRDIQKSQIITLKVNGADRDGGIGGLISPMIVLVLLMGGAYWWFRLRKSDPHKKK